MTRERTAEVGTGHPLPLCRVTPPPLPLAREGKPDLQGFSEEFPQIANFSVSVTLVTAPDLPYGASCHREAQSGLRESREDHHGQQE